MRAQAGLAVIAGLGLAAGAGLLLARQAAAQEEVPPPHPLAAEIASAQTLAELDAYYVLINLFYTAGGMDQATYEELYAIYSARYYELTHGIVP